MSPLLILGNLLLMLGFLVLALTGHHVDNLGGPILGILGILAVLLSVGLTERITTHHKGPNDE